MSSENRIVAIDGPAGSGKSTLARGLATILHLPYVNTGVMYRALTAAALRNGVSPEDVDGLLDLTRGLRFTLARSDPPVLDVEGYDDRDLTSPAVEAAVSSIARHPRVRRWMRDAQRVLGSDGAVIEGRDIGSVVFPEAVVKFFLEAHPEARVRRRAEERPHGDPDETAAALQARDALDARTNPLTPPARAIVIDTGGLDAEATLRTALAAIRELAPELVP